MWRSRGCIPVSVEVTASIVEMLPLLRFSRKILTLGDDLNDSSSQSEEMFSYVILHGNNELVNGVVEKTQKKYEISIGEAADAIGIPRMLIDIRHEGSHRDLPSLQLVRLASNKIEVLLGKSANFDELMAAEEEGKEIEETDDQN
ncbi:hypothetical protein CASFOL_000919 [Castilleja foliolosa]|uniref:Uncharacterized protein n=1 Tax=Castilleja foliolosa TaxID=1961234 RepID=A0ABD3EL19_9LAMI